MSTKYIDFVGRRNAIKIEPFESIHMPPYTRIRREITERCVNVNKIDIEHLLLFEALRFAIYLKPNYGLIKICAFLHPNKKD